jgi:hypothetical protein
MNVNYHFLSNRPGLPAVWLTIDLKDKDGNVFKTLRLPDPEANLWLRHRQSQMALWLNNDVPGPPPGAPKVGMEEPMVTAFFPEGPRKLRYMTAPENKLRGGLGVQRPSDISLSFANAYARYLQRETGAAKVEIVRHAKPPIPPSVLFVPTPVTPDDFAEETASFGDLPHAEAPTRNQRR